MVEVSRCFRFFSLFKEETGGVGGGGDAAGAAGLAGPWVGGDTKDIGNSTWPIQQVD